MRWHQFTFYVGNNRIKEGLVIGLATGNERIMEANEYHHGRENMFVAASSYTVPKGSALAVSLSF